MMQPVSKFACPTSHHYGMRRQPMVAPTPRTRAAAAAAAKSLQSCPTLCDPIDGLPPGSPVWDSPGKNTGVCCHFLLQYMQVKSESEDVQSCPTLSDLMDCGLQDPPSMGFSRQEYWSGVPLPSLRTRAVNLIIRLQRDQYKDKASNPSSDSKSSTCLITSAMPPQNFSGSSLYKSKSEIGKEFIFPKLLAPNSRADCREGVCCMKLQTSGFKHGRIQVNESWLIMIQI